MIKKIILLAFYCFFCSGLYAILENNPVLDKYKRFDRMSPENLKAAGNLYLKNDIRDSSLICLTLYCDRFDPNGKNDKEKKEFANTCNLTGSIYYNYSNFTKAMTFFMKGLTLCESIGYDSLTVQLYNNIGNVYLAFKEYNKAVHYFNMSYVKGKKCGYNNSIYLPLNNLVIAHCYLHNLKSARFYMNKISKVEREGNIELNQSLFNSLGAVNMNLESYDSAVYYFKKAFKNESGSYKQNCVALSNTGSAFKEMGRNDSAVYYFNLSNKMAGKNNLLNLMSINYKQLSQIYENNGHYKLALFYNKEYEVLKDSVLDIHNYGEVKDKQFVYEMDKIGKELELLNAEKEIQYTKINSQRSILQTISIAFLLILILLIIVYIQKQKLGKSYKNLFIKNVDIIHSEAYNRELRVEYEHILNSIEKVNEVNTNPRIPVDFRKDELLPDIKNIMDNTRTYCNIDFTLETLAELVNSNTKYVSLTINNEFGKNFNTFVNEYRIKEACRLLISPESKLYTIETIASMVGFKSKSSFNPIFKKITGLTPSQYQKISIDSYKE